jgi:hypothetical protein
LQSKEPTQKPARGHPQNGPDPRPDVTVKKYPRHSSKIPLQGTPGKEKNRQEKNRGIRAVRRRQSPKKPRDFIEQVVGILET